MKLGELAAIVFISTLIFGAIIISIVSIFVAYNDYKEYHILKQECNQNMNKDLCFCYGGYCEVSYSCNGGSIQTTTETINNELINSPQTKLEGTCKDYEKRLCEIATKAESKDWVWRYCK